MQIMPSQGKIIVECIVGEDVNGEKIHDRTVFVGRVVAVGNYSPPYSSCKEGDIILVSQGNAINISSSLWIVHFEDVLARKSEEGKDNV